VPEWTRWSVGFFVYVALAAGLRPGLSTRARLRAWCGSALGLGLALAGARMPPRGIAAAWILPPVVLLLGYWTSGVLFVRPMPRAERALAGLDRALRIDAIAARCPRLLAECLELSYSGIYVSVVVALALALRQGMTPDRFWTVVLVTDYLCFATLPWLQTRPPRALGHETPWRSGWRSVNRRLLDAGSVQVNTFPSGHAAEALVAALLVIGAPAPLVALMFVNAAATSAGAVLGRYHYAADALTGWALAVAVYLLVK
jgi:membrane-associated phospholipid phosphatase